MDNFDIEVIDENLEENKEESYKKVQKIIKAECEESIAVFFEKDSEIIDAYYEIIEKTDLISPFKNYLIAKEFLDKVYNFLLMQDKNFANPTLIKLKRDLDFIYAKYNEFKSKSLDHKRIFENYIFKKSNISYVLNSQIISLKKRKNLSTPFKKELQSLEKTIKELKHFYFFIYEDIYFEYKLSIQEEYQDIINTFLLYFEKMMWNDAKYSKTIQKKFQSLSIENLDTKSYIKHHIKIMNPYSQSYKNTIKIYRNYL